MKKIYLNKEECRNCEINILNTIHKICEENKLKYYICGGTMLGAIRHEGFIPWDDDIDIMLLRKDYNKLIEILKSQKKYPWLSVLDSNTKGYYYTFAKVVDNRTVAKMEDNITEHGLWVDIFPYDNLPNDKKIRQKYILKGYLYRSIVMSMTTDFNTNLKIKNKTIKILLNIYSKFIDREKFIKKYEKFSQKYENEIDIKYVGSLFSPYKLRECFDIKWFEKQKMYKFENNFFYGPENYDEYLTQLYGDYMQLPPEDKRRNHKIIAWKK